MSLKDELKKLDGLYEKTGKDWELVAHITLTEPTCPTVIIRPEGSSMVRYRVDRDTLEEGIRAAVDLVHREVILGQRIESECPYTNPDDRT